MFGQLSDAAFTLLNDASSAFLLTTPLTLSAFSEGSPRCAHVLSRGAILHRDGQLCVGNTASDLITSMPRLPTRRKKKDNQVKSASTFQPSVFAPSSSLRPPRTYLRLIKQKARRAHLITAAHVVAAADFLRPTRAKRSPACLRAPDAPSLFSLSGLSRLNPPGVDSRTFARH